MNDVIRIKRSIKGKENPYFQYRRATAQDRGVSWEARGILAYLLSKPDDWQVRPTDLQQGCGRDKVYRVLNELIKAGYIRRITLKNEKSQIQGIEYEVYEEPLPEIPYTENKDITDKREIQNRDSLAATAASVRAVEMTTLSALEESLSKDSDYAAGDWRADSRYVWIGGSVTGQKDSAFWQGPRNDYEKYCEWLTNYGPISQLIPDLIGKTLVYVGPEYQPYLRALVDTITTIAQPDAIDRAQNDAQNANGSKPKPKKRTTKPKFTEEENERLKPITDAYAVYMGCEEPTSEIWRGWHIGVVLPLFKQFKDQGLNAEIFIQAIQERQARLGQDATKITTREAILKALLEYYEHHKPAQTRGNPDCQLCSGTGYRYDKSQPDVIQYDCECVKEKAHE